MVCNHYFWRYCNFSNARFLWDTVYIHNWSCQITIVNLGPETNLIVTGSDHVTGFI